MAEDELAGLSREELLELVRRQQAELAARDEREGLRSELKQATQRAKDAELRLAREENRATRLEERLNSEVSGSVDKDAIIERRIGEINRFERYLSDNGTVVLKFFLHLSKREQWKRIARPTTFN